MASDNDCSFDANDSVDNAAMPEQELFAQLVDLFVREIRFESASAGRDLVTEAKVRLKNRLRVQKERIKTTIVNSRQAWSRKRADMPFCRLIDRISFTFGVLSSFLTFFLLPLSVPWLVTWYSYLIVGLITIRMYLYRKMNWSAYLFDFCYYSTSLFLCYLHFAPKTGVLFVYVFSFSNGPLAWAVPLWRNSLVFHDIDKLTSCALHYLPMLLTYQLRWLQNETSPYFSTCSPEQGECETRWVSHILQPLVLYMLWQVAYLLKTETRAFRLSKPVSVAEDEKEMTSFKHLEQADGSVKKIIDYLDRAHVIKVKVLPQRKCIFLLLQLLFTVISFLPAFLFFFSFYMHTLFVIVISVICVWNGASFYVEIFTTRYQYRDQSKAALERASASLSGTAEPVDTSTSTPGVF